MALQTYARILTFILGLGLLFFNPVKAQDTGVIAVVVNSASNDPAYFGPDTTDIALVNLSTGKLENVTQSPDVDEYSPTWSPNGAQLAFVAGEPLQPDSNIFIMDVADRKTRQVTQSGGSQDGLDWSPDGRSLLFVNPVFRVNYPIGTLPLDGSEGLVIVDQGDSPTSSPD